MKKKTNLTGRKRIGFVLFYASSMLLLFIGLVYLPAVFTFPLLYNIYIPIEPGVVTTAIAVVAMWISLSFIVDFSE